MNLGALSDVWAGFWEPRTAREKLLLTWGGVAIGVVVAYSILWAPAQQGRTHLRETLPAMQRQIAQEEPDPEPADTDGRRTVRPSERHAGARHRGLDEPGDIEPVSREHQPGDGQHRARVPLQRSKQ